MGGSLLTHSLAGALGIWLSTLPRSFAAHEPMGIAPRYDLVWLTPPGPGGGGGGGAGGDQTKVVTPVHQVVRERLTVPMASEPKLVETTKEPPLIEPLTIPAAPLEIAPPVLNPTPSTEMSPGPGSRGGGGGNGSSTGSGEGQGSGLGPGSDGGTGGGAYRAGSGVTIPQLVSDAKPDYTADAMRAKVQGVVVLECVVLPNGTIGNITIIKSLDKVFGLDQEAVKAARQWRFLPGRRLGQPVPVFVTLELVFTLR